MNINTFSDSYLFFIDNIGDADLILAILQWIDLQIEKIQSSVDHFCNISIT